jgi:putative membrane protein
MIWAWLINSVAVYVTAKILPGVELKNFWTAIGVAAGISIVNILLKPVLAILSLPFILLTQGLFIWVIDALLIMLVDKIFEGFKIKNFGWALGSSLILSLISTVLIKIFG